MLSAHLTLNSTEEKKKQCNLMDLSSWNHIDREFSFEVEDNPIRAIVDLITSCNYGPWLNSTNNLMLFTSSRN